MGLTVYARILHHKRISVRQSFVTINTTGDSHKYLAETQQYWAQGYSYRHKFLAAFFINIWRPLAYRHKYLANSHLRYQNLQLYTAHPGLYRRSV